jgi:hypothetical protein
MFKKIILILLVLLLLVGDVLLIIGMFKGANLFINISTVIITLPLIMYFISFSFKSN